MHFSLLAACFCLLLVRRAESSPAASLGIENRAACNQDNLLRALSSPSRLSDSYQFCSAYLSIPLTSTITYTTTCVLSSYAEVETIVHPLYLYNLQPQTTSEPPLTYDSTSPTPSPIPGGAQYYGWPAGVPHAKRDSPLDTPPEPLPTPPPTLPHELLRRSGTTLPSYIATTYPPSRLSSACSCLSVPAAYTTTVSNGFYFSIDTTTTCTSYVPTTVATYPAICAPSLQVNAPAPASHAFYVVTPSFSVPSKMDCCAACTSVFNCVWWKFDFGTVGDGWEPGTCHYAYYTGPAVDDGEGPAICPNGETNGIVNFSAQFGRQANNNDPGYNFGACGGAFNLYESNEDDGYPDDYSEHYCGQPSNDPVYNPPGC